MSGIKTGLGYIKNSFSQLLKGFVLFLLATSGLGVAVLLREFGFNGSTIASVSIILEAVGLILSYLLLRKNISIKEEDEDRKPKGKDKFK